MKFMFCDVDGVDDDLTGARVRLRAPSTAPNGLSVSMSVMKRMML